MTRIKNRGTPPPPFRTKTAPGVVGSTRPTRRHAKRPGPLNLARAVHTAAVQLRRMVSRGAKQLGPALFRAADVAATVANTLRPAAGKIAGSVLELASLTAEMTEVLQPIDSVTSGGGGILGQLLLDSEFVTQRPLLTNDQQATLRQTFQTLRKDIRRTMRVGSDFPEQVHLVMRELYARHLQRYGEGKALIIGYLGTPPDRGNCEASTKLVVAVFSELGITEADGWTLGVQKYDDHIQPVLYHAEDGLVWNLMAGSLSAEIDAPIYRPEFLLDGFVRGRGMKSPSSVEALRLAAPNVPPRKGVAAPPTARSNSNLSFAPGTGVGVYRDGPTEPETTLQSPYEGDAQEMSERFQRQSEKQTILSRALNAYREHPDDPETCYRVANVFHDFRQYTQALTYARKVEQLQPENRNSKVIILVSLNEMDRHEEALQLATHYADTIGDPVAAKVYRYEMQRALIRIALQPGATVEQLHRARDALTDFLSTWPDGVDYFMQDEKFHWQLDQDNKQYLVAVLAKIQDRLATKSQPPQ